MTNSAKKIYFQDDFLGERMRILFLAKPTLHFLICLILVFIIRQNYYALRSNNNFEFLLDSSISRESSKYIEDFFKDHKNLLLDDLAKNCVEKFSPVKNITFRKHLDKIRVFLESGSPILNVNNKFVITDNNKIVEIGFFTEGYLKELPVIISKYELNNELANFLTKFTYKTFEKYSVEIEERNRIWFKFKENPKINILTSLDFVPTKQLIKIANKILEEKLNSLKKNRYVSKLGSHPSTSSGRAAAHGEPVEPYEQLWKKSNNKFVADLRFKDQIVIFQI